MQNHFLLYKSVSSSAPSFGVVLVSNVKRSVPPPHPQTWILDFTLLWHHLNICSHQSLRSTNERESFVDIAPPARVQYSTQKFDAIVNFCTFVLQLLLQFNDIVPAGDALMQVPLEPSIDFIYGYWIINPSSGNLWPICLRSFASACTWSSIHR
jgi:hypothetical protein